MEKKQYLVQIKVEVEAESLIAALTNAGTKLGSGVQDDKVNVAVFDANGRQFSLSEVLSAVEEGVNAL